MPIEAMNKLTKKSSTDAITEAVSSCIATEISAGRKRKQAVAMCYNMARAKTGKTSLLSPK